MGHRAVAALVVACGLLAGAQGLTVQADTGTVLQQIAGIYLGQGVQCPQVRLPDGEQISLEGLPQPLAVSQAVAGQVLHLSGKLCACPAACRDAAFGWKR